MKQEIRILGIDDSPFLKNKSKTTKLIGVFMRGGRQFDGLLSTRAKIDGYDATDKIIEMVKKTKFKKQLRAILLNGIAVGGFNTVNIKKISKKTKIPAIIVIRVNPDIKGIIKLLKILKRPKSIKDIRDAGKVHKVRNVFIQFSGITKSKAIEIIKITAVHSHIPEPLRIAHLIASGVHYGESRGKA